ncbi:hypothetical protein MMA231_03404 [Asticcacaulis sp. MM231]|uniref:hypothetical protein n=1 Tax=Asticcacaulis sp. MM231 TaxID=3157666 RepID=UPI0032D5ABFF
MLRRTLLGAGGAYLALCWSATAETYAPLRAQTVRDSIGVNTHINYTDGAYRRIADVITALDYLGVKHVRDSAPRLVEGGDLPLKNYIWMSKAGIRFNLVMGGQIKQSYEPKRSLLGLQALEKAQPGAIETIEEFNEVNNWPLTYQGKTGITASIAAHKATVALLRADPLLRKKPIFDMTGDDEVASLKERGDFHNAHIYAQNGHQPLVWMDQTGEANRGKPWVITEFGYASNPESGWLVIGVGEAGQARGVLNGIMDAQRHKASRIYLYELLDQKPDPEGKEKEMHFGLFRLDNKPKPAATALRNLLRIIEDRDPAAKTFKPTPLNLTLAGQPDTVQSVTLQKATGKSQIVLWNEVTFWDRATGKPIDNPSVPVRVTLPAGTHATALYDPMKQAQPIRTFNDKGVVTVLVPDYPVILEVTPDA